MSVFRSQGKWKSTFYPSGLASFHVFIMHTLVSPYSEKMHAHTKSLLFFFIINTNTLSRCASLKFWKINLHRGRRERRPQNQSFHQADHHYCMMMMMMPLLLFLYSCCSYKVYSHKRIDVLCVICLRQISLFHSVGPRWLWYASVFK